VIDIPQQVPDDVVLEEAPSSVKDDVGDDPPQTTSIMRRGAKMPRPLDTEALGPFSPLMSPDDSSPRPPLLSPSTDMSPDEVTATGPTDMFRGTEVDHAAADLLDTQIQQLQHTLAATMMHNNHLLGVPALNVGAAFLSPSPKISPQLHMLPPPASPSLLPLVLPPPAPPQLPLVLPPSASPLLHSPPHSAQASPPFSLALSYPATQPTAKPSPPPALPFSFVPRGFVPVPQPVRPPQRVGKKKHNRRKRDKEKGQTATRPLGWVPVAQNKSVEATTTTTPATMPQLVTDKANVTVLNTRPRPAPILPLPPPLPLPPNLPRRPNHRDAMDLSKPVLLHPRPSPTLTPARVSPDSTVSHPLAERPAERLELDNASQLPSPPVSLAPSRTFTSPESMGSSRHGGIGSAGRRAWKWLTNLGREWGDDGDTGDEGREQGEIVTAEISMEQPNSPVPLTAPTPPDPPPLRHELTPPAPPLTQQRQGVTPPPALPPRHGSVTAEFDRNRLLQIALMEQQRSLMTDNLRAMLQSDRVGSRPTTGPPDRPAEHNPRMLMASSDQMQRYAHSRDTAKLHKALSGKGGVLTPQLLRTQPQHHP